MDEFNLWGKQNIDRKQVVLSVVWPFFCQERELYQTICVSIDVAVHPASMTTQQPRPEISNIP